MPQEKKEYQKEKHCVKLFGWEKKMGIPELRMQKRPKDLRSLEELSDVSALKCPFVTEQFRQSDHGKI
jgi:hypothetical protein